MMKNLVKSFLLKGLILGFALFMPCMGYAQSVSEKITTKITAEEAENIAAAGGNWQKWLASGKAVKNADGGYIITFDSKAEEDSFWEYAGDALADYKTNNAQQNNPADEGQGIKIDSSGIENNAGTSTLDTPLLTAPSLTEGLQSPQDNLNDTLNKTFNQGVIEQDFQNMIDAEMAGLDVEIAKINDELAGGNATGSGGGGQCANAENIFQQIACKAMMFLVDLRVLAYIISGFGMVAFAYAAIFNKISWKHFSQIAIGLFMLSMIGPFITYFTGDSTVEGNLQYGNYLGGGYNQIQGAGGVQCADGSTDCTPDTDVSQEETAAAKKSWSLKDLKGSIQSGLNLIRSGYNAYQGAKQVVQNVKTEAQNIGNAIKNSGGGLDGILNAASQVAGASNRLSFDVKTGLGGITSQISNAANAAQDITATNEEREERQNIRVNGGADGNTTNAVSEWLSASGEGGQALSKVSQATDTVGKAAAGVGKATTAGHEGQKIGGNGGFGDVVGGIFAAGTAVSEGIGVYDQVQQENAVKQQQQAQTSQSQLSPAQQAAQQVANAQTKSTAQSSSSSPAATSAKSATTTAATTHSGSSAKTSSATVPSMATPGYQAQSTSVAGNSNAGNNSATTSTSSVPNSGVLDTDGRIMSQAEVTQKRMEQAASEELPEKGTIRVQPYDNGDTAITYSNGKVAYKDAAGNISVKEGKHSVQINADGSMTMNLSNGTKRIMQKDGSVIYKQADGTEKVYEAGSKTAEQYKAYAESITSRFEQINR